MFYIRLPFEVKITEECGWGAEIVKSGDLVNFETLNYPLERTYSIGIFFVN